MTTDEADASNRFVDGGLLRPLLTLAAPLLVTQLLQVLYNLTDTFWVGRLGPEAVSALSFSWPIVFLIISAGAGFTNAGTILVSQNTGAGNTSRARQVAGQTLSFVSLLALALSVLGYLFTPQLLQLIGADPGTVEFDLALEYVQIIFLGLPLTFGFFVFQSLMRGHGDTTTPMYLMIGSVGLNVLLDPFFVLGFEGNPLFAWLGAEHVAESLLAATGFTGYGVSGAAVATIISRGLAVGVGYWLLFSGHLGLQISLANVSPELSTVRDVVRLGVPAAIDHSTQALSVTIMTALVAIVGTDAVAAYGVGNRFTSLVWLPTVAMGMAVETMVGQNLGSNEHDRVRKVVFLAIGILGAVFLFVSAGTYYFADPIVGLFVQGEGSAAVVAHGSEMLRIVAPTWIIMVVFHMMNGAFYGAGSPRLSMALGVTTLWGMRAAVATVLIVSVGIGATGAWYGIAVSNVVAAVVATVFFFDGRWMKSVVDDDPIRVGFVSSADDGRGQMATAYAELECQRRGLEERVEILRGGTDPGDAVPDVVVEAMAERGADLSGSEPQPVDPDELQECDVVASIDARLQSLDGDVDVHDWALPDPRDQDLDTVRGIREDVRERVVGLFDDVDGTRERPGAD